MRKAKKNEVMTMLTSTTNTELSDTSLSAEVKYDGLVITGFVSKRSNIAEPFAFSKLFMTTKWDKITAVTDDIPLRVKD